MRDEMKVTGISTMLFELPFEHGGPYRPVAGRLFDRLPVLLVRIVTADGLVGWGEPFALTSAASAAAAIEHLIAPILVGQDSSSIETTMLDLQTRLHYFGRNGPVMSGISAVDIALWDIAGKRAGRPLCDLLGGSPLGEIEAYASLMTYGTPSLVARVTERVQGEGYRKIKLHQQTPADVKAARDAADPSCAFMLDVNCAWTPSHAIDAIAALESFRLDWIEEPVWPPEDFRGLAEVRASSNIPVAAGENLSGPVELSAMLELGAVDIAQPSATRGGGVTEMRKSIALANASGAVVRPHCAQIGPGYLATLHVTAALVPDAAIERLYLNFEVDPYGGAVTPQRGRVTLPKGPGLGFEPDLVAMDRFRAR